MYKSVEASSPEGLVAEADEQQGDGSGNLP
jgi:hypothetical protein